MAQINTLVGDVEGNTRRVLEVTLRVRDEAFADLVVFPELTLTGYPPEDLLMRCDMTERTEAALTKLCQSLPNDVVVIVGYPKKRETVK